MFQYGTNDAISNFPWSAVMDKTIHVLWKEQEMGNIRACFPFKLSLVKNIYMSICDVTQLTGILEELFSLQTAHLAITQHTDPSWLHFTYVPGTSRSVSAKDQVGDGSVRLMPPGEHRFCCPTKVCVWPLQSVKQKSHRAVGSSLQAFRQILQILEREGSESQRACSARQQPACHSSISDQWAWCAWAAHLLAHRPALAQGLPRGSEQQCWHFRQGRSGLQSKICLRLILSVYFENPNEVITYDTPWGCFAGMSQFIFTQTWSKTETSGASSSFLWRIGWGWRECLLK